MTAPKVKSLVSESGEVLSTFTVDPRAHAFAATRGRGAELMAFNPSYSSADADILPAKRELDAKSRDHIRNDGHIAGARILHIDNVVGHQFKLSAKPNYRLLKKIDARYDEVWARELSEAAEALFENYAEDETNCWLDGQRVQPFTQQARFVAGQMFDVGEVLSTSLFKKRFGSPYQTAIQFVDVDRLSNPRGMMDTKTLRRGVELGRQGEPIAYNIQMGHPNDGMVTGINDYQWKRVSRFTRWGRVKAFHIFDRHRADQNRGVSQLVSILEDIDKTKRYQKLVLQNLATSALYAATLESDLDRELALSHIDVEMPDGTMEQVDYFDAYMGKISEYAENAPNIKLDGVKIPYLPVGTKLNMQAAPNAGGIGSEFEESFKSKMASGLGMSLEVFDRNWSKVNYSSARAGGLENWKHFLASRRIGPSRFGNYAYRLFFEEAFYAGDLPMPSGGRLDFWEYPGAFAGCTFRGSGRGQIDPVKETQAALMRIGGRLSTYEREMAELHGDDWRDVVEQQSIEEKYFEEKNLQMPQISAKGKIEATGREDSPDNPDDEEKQEEASDFELTATLGQKRRVRVAASV